MISNHELAEVRNLERKARQNQRKRLDSCRLGRCALFPDRKVPAGKMGKKFVDGSYYYFNADGSVYCQTVAPTPTPGTPSRFGNSLYISPVNSLHYTPSLDERERDGGRYFIGYDYKTIERLYYWHNEDGIIVRTLMKNLDFSTGATPLEQHDVRTYTNKHGVERVIIVDEDWNYVGKNKVIMEELKELPEEPQLELPMTSASTNQDVEVKLEISIKTEELVDLPMAPGQERAIDHVDTVPEVNIKIEDSSSLVTPVDSSMSTTAEGADEVEDANEQMSENIRDGEDTPQGSVSSSPHDATLTISVSKTDSRPRSTRTTRSTATESFAFRVTKATIRKGGK